MSCPCWPIRAVPSRLCYLSCPILIGLSCSDLAPPCHACPALASYFITWLFRLGFSVAAVLAVPFWLICSDIPAPCSGPFFSPAQPLAWPQTSPFSPPTHTCKCFTDNDDSNMLDSSSVTHSYPSVRFCFSGQAVVFWLSCSGCPILAVWPVLAVW